MGNFVVIQDGWLPEPFDTEIEAKQYRDQLDLEATRAGTPTRVHIYQLLPALFAFAATVLTQLPD